MLKCHEYYLTILGSIAVVLVGLLIVVSFGNVANAVCSSHGQCTLGCENGTPPACIVVIDCDTKEGLCDTCDCDGVQTCTCQ